MTRDVVSAHPDDPTEEAANKMRERRIGCLPVVEDGTLVGILTSSDVMEALVQLIGAHEPGSRLVASMPDRPGALAGAAGIFGVLGINIVSVVAGTREGPPPRAGGDLGGGGLPQDNQRTTGGDRDHRAVGHHVICA